MRSAIAAIKERSAPLENPYFQSLRDGSMTREQFVETQIQFFHAVIFFSRPMAALVGRIPRPQMRLALLENLGDEHGGGRLTVCHENTFIELLSRLGVERSDVDSRAMWPEVRAFNMALLGTCALDDVYTGMAALGMVEDLFAGISAEIGQGIVARGWLKRDEIVHYTTHEGLDVAHAEGFYASLHEPYERHPRWRYQIQQGLELGAYVFLRLYEDLYRAGDRFELREVRGPHTISDGAWLEPEAHERRPAP
jgi:pyrroloquinoline quinone (PQQ) biosynthesis protein C